MAAAARSFTAPKREPERLRTANPAHAWRKILILDVIHARNALREPASPALRRLRKKTYDALLSQALLANQSLILLIARRYLRHVTSLEVEDLVQHGYIAMLRALDTYEEEKSSFNTYARWWIRSYIGAAVANDETVQFSQVARNNIWKITRARNAFSQEHGRTPTTQELAKLTKLEVSQVKDYTSMHRYTISFDERLGEEGQETRLDLTPDPNPLDVVEAVDEAQRAEFLQHAVDGLRPREQTVIREMFWNGKSFPEIGALMGVSRQRVQQIEVKALEKIRARAKSAAWMK